MNLKKIVKGPWLWIVIIAIVVFGVLQFSSSDGYREVETATMVRYFDEGKVEKVTFVEGEQQIRATLKKDDEQVRATWLGNQGSRMVQQAEQAVEDKKLKSFDVDKPTAGIG